MMRWTPRDLAGILVPKPLNQEALGRESTMEDNVIAVDLAKDVFEIAVSPKPRRVERAEAV